MEEVGRGVPVDGHDGKLLEKEGLGFAELVVAGVGVAEAGGFFVEAVVFGAAPAGLLAVPVACRLGWQVSTFHRQQSDPDYGVTVLRTGLSL